MKTTDYFPKESILEFLDTPVSEVSYEKLANELTLENLIYSLTFPNLDAESTQLTIKTIEKCFTLKSLRKQMLSNEKIYGIFKEASTSPMIEIKALLANSLEVCSYDRENMVFLEKPIILEILINLLTDTELKIFINSEKALLKIARTSSPAQEILSNHSSMDIFFEKVQTCDQIIKFRILGFLLNLGKISNSLFDTIKAKGIYDHVLELFIKDDLIIKINSLELLHEMISFNRGVAFINSPAFPEFYLRELEKSSFEPITTGLLYFLSEIISKNPELTEKIFSSHSGIFKRKLEDYLSEGASFTDGGTKLICFINCWSKIISNIEPLEIMTNSVPNSLSQVATFISGTAGRDIAICAMSALINALKDGTNVKDQLKSYVEREVIDKVLIQIMNDPFQDTRTAAYNLLKTLISHYPLAAEMFFNSKQHRELLLNSNSDSDPDAKYAKYHFTKLSMQKYRELIITLAGSNYTKSIDSYISGGPYYRYSDPSISVQDMAL